MEKQNEIWMEFVSPYDGETLTGPILMKVRSKEGMPGRLSAAWFYAKYGITWVDIGQVDTVEPDGTIEFEWTAPFPYIWEIRAVGAREGMSEVFSEPIRVTVSDSHDVWLTQRSSGQAEAGRMMLSLRTADHDPVGLRKIGNESLSVKVSILSGNALPTLIIGSFDRETVRHQPLQEGENTVDGEAGDLYLQFASATPSKENQVKVEFIKGYIPLPFYIQGQTSNEEWRSMLNTHKTPNVTLVSEKSFIVCSREKALEFQDKNQEEVLALIDRAMKAEHAISGLDSETPADKPWEGKVMIVERTGGYMDATHEGRVRVVSWAFNRVLDPTVIANNGWGLFHEMGHHHQMYNWTFSAVGEVNPNIYTLAANEEIVEGYTWLKDDIWTELQRYFALPDSNRDFTDSTTPGNIRLSIYRQLWLAYGDSFFHGIHKLVRKERPTPSDDIQEIRLFLLYACRAVGRNLSDLFRKYGFRVNESIYEEIADLGFPQPDIDITTLNEN